jgi:hypothetical protein
VVLSPSRRRAWVAPSSYGATFLKCDTPDLYTTDGIGFTAFILFAQDAISIDPQSNGDEGRKGKNEFKAAAAYSQG